MVYNIPIHGEIGRPEQPQAGVKYFTMQDLLLHLNKAKDFDTLNLDIDSPGGFCDVADRMIDAIRKTGKPTTSCNSGNVASAASKIFTISPLGARFFYPERGDFLIHNPWGDNVSGDSMQLAAISQELKSLENDYAVWYSKSTGVEKSIIASLMQEDTPLTSDQIEQFNFAIIKHDESAAAKAPLSAVAKISINSKTSMAESNEELKKGFAKLETLMTNFFAKFKPKAIMLNDANGQEIEFPDIQDMSQLAVGTPVNIAGSPAPDGDVILPDGTTIQCVGGKVANIIPAGGNPEMEALKQENEALKTQVTELTAKFNENEKSLGEAVNAMASVKKEFNSFKAQFSSYKPAAGSPEGSGEPNQNRKPFKAKA